MKTLLRDPLLHFLVAGLALFFLWGLWGNDGTPGQDTIVVGPQQIRQLQASWAKQWRRPPTPKELQRLVDNYVQEEVLNRQALALGLGKGDIIIRRRLAQKMRFLIQDIADQARPGEADLKAYFEKHRDKYKNPARVSFTHVYLNADRRGSSATADAKRLLRELRKDNPERAPDRGDGFMLNYDYAEVSQLQAQRLFGQSFGPALFALKPGQWLGPIRSGYGLHLVRVAKKTPETIPKFVEALERVRADYKDDVRRKANQKAIKAMKSRYRIEIDSSAMGATQ